MVPILGFVPGSYYSVIAFSSICVAILVLFVGASTRAVPKSSNTYRVVSGWTFCVVLYCSLIAGIVYSGLLDRPFLPNGPIFIVASISLAIALGFAPLGTKIMSQTSVALLIGFQSFRLPLELVLRDWYLSGTIPETMTWTGSNWDIVTGILALLLTPFAEKRRWLGWLFNMIGIILLINVGRVAIFSSPVPWGWQVEPPLELILYLPYAFIVPICVGGAALGHVLLTRRLLMREAS